MSSGLISLTLGKTSKMRFTTRAAISSPTLLEPACGLFNESRLLEASIERFNRPFSSKLKSLTVSRRYKASFSPLYEPATYF